MTVRTIVAAVIMALAPALSWAAGPNAFEFRRPSDNQPRGVLDNDGNVIFPGSGTFQGNGATQYSIETASGIKVNAGPINLGAGGYLRWPDGTTSTTAASGGGGGGGTPTMSYLKSGTGATYNTPTNAKALFIRMVGAGGGGGGCGTSYATAGSNGSSTTFAGVVANPGKGATTGSRGGAGGTGGAGTANFRVDGATAPGNTAYYIQPLQGAPSAFGGGGAGAWNGSEGSGWPASPNSGAGGGGCTWNAGYWLPGGGAGEYVELFLTAPLSSTYSYTVGAGGAGGVGSNSNGGAGGSGIIIITEYY